MPLRWAMGSVGVVLVAALVVGLSPPPQLLAAEDRREVPETEGLLARGVSRDTIKIGMHAPITGAAPTPTTSLERGKDLLFRWLKSRGVDIHGRNVRVILRNDQHNPSTAVAVCKEMVEQNHVFMLMGFQGVDQMQACARYAASRDVPYVSPGSTSIVLKELRNYFATSMTYRAEARLMAEYFARVMGARDERNGVLSYNAPNWSPAATAFVRAMEERGVDVHYQRQVSNAAGSTEARVVVGEMKAAGIDNVLIMSTPVWFLQVLMASGTEEFSPRWTGISATAAYDRIPQGACGNGGGIHGARFFSPYPAFVDSNRYDPDFRVAAERFYPDSEPDDFMFQLWALDRVIAKMLRLAGPSPTFDRFVRRVERSDKIVTGIGPTLRYSRRDHLGASRTHVLKVDCAAKRWQTARSFVSGF
jgi:ABC-type branched-subunit amino acid transport system substrate-binding protein